MADEITANDKRRGHLLIDKLWKELKAQDAKLESQDAQLRSQDAKLKSQDAQLRSLVPVKQEIVRVKKEPTKVKAKRSRPRGADAIYPPSTPPEARSGAGGAAKGVAGTGFSEICPVHKKWLGFQCEECWPSSDE